MEVLESCVLGGKRAEHLARYSYYFLSVHVHNRKYAVGHGVCRQIFMTFERRAYEFFQLSRFSPLNSGVQASSLLLQDAKSRARTQSDAKIFFIVLGFSGFVSRKRCSKKHYFCCISFIITIVLFLCRIFRFRFQTERAEEDCPSLMHLRQALQFRCLSSRKA